MYDSNTNASTPTLVEFVNDDSSGDFISSTVYALFLLLLDTFQMEVDQPHYDCHGQMIVFPTMSPQLHYVLQRYINQS